jgi:hypothetical protein
VSVPHGRIPALALTILVVAAPASAKPSRTEATVDHGGLLAHYAATGCLSAVVTAAR